MGKKKKANIATEIWNIKKAIKECREKLYFLYNLEKKDNIVTEIAETQKRFIALSEKLEEKQNIGGF